MKIKKLKKINLKKLRKSILKRQLEMAFLVLLLILSFWVYISDTPTKFEGNKLIKIEEGSNVKDIAEIFKSNNLIKSRTLFSTILIIQSKDNKIVAGEYLFENPETIFHIIERVTEGDYGITSETVTLKEGLTLDQMADILDDTFPNFNRKQFEIKTSLHEGYYFPDTYIFPENADTDLIVKTLRDNFESKIEDIKDIVDASDKTLEEIIIMASIIEKEATADSRQEISNILWKRMEVGMPLQVDATFVYERGKGTFDLTTADLRQDSPYNTYTNAGLPPTAIANPGIDSIIAAAKPEPTEYLFFLTGYDGEMYYAETHDQHVSNKQKFLN